MTPKGYQLRLLLTTKCPWVPNFTLFHSMTGRFHSMIEHCESAFCNFTSAPNDLQMTCWMLQGQSLIYVKQLIISTTTLVQNFTPFCCTVTHFPDNFKLFDFSISPIWHFRKKITKNRKLKISKIPNIVLWGKLEGKFRGSSKSVGIFFFLFQAPVVVT